MNTFLPQFAYGCILALVVASYSWGMQHQDVSKCIRQIMHVPYINDRGMIERYDGVLAQFNNSPARWLTALAARGYRLQKQNGIWYITRGLNGGGWWSIFGSGAPTPAMTVGITAGITATLVSAKAAVIAGATAAAPTIGVVALTSGVILGGGYLTYKTAQAINYTARCTGRGLMYVGEGVYNWYYPPPSQQEIVAQQEQSQRGLVTQQQRLIRASIQQGSYGEVHPVLSIVVAGPIREDIGDLTILQDVYTCIHKHPENEALILEHIITALNKSENLRGHVQYIQEHPNIGIEEFSPSVVTLVQGLHDWVATHKNTAILACINNQRPARAAAQADGLDDEKEDPQQIVPHENAYDIIITCLKTFDCFTHPKYEKLCDLLEKIRRNEEIQALQRLLELRSLFKNGEQVFINILNAISNKTLWITVMVQNMCNNTANKKFDDIPHCFDMLVQRATNDEERQYCRNVQRAWGFFSLEDPSIQELEQATLLFQSLRQQQGAIRKTLYKFADDGLVKVKTYCKKHLDHELLNDEQFKKYCALAASCAQTPDEKEIFEQQMYLPELSELSEQLQKDASSAAPAKIILFEELREWQNLLEDVDLSYRLLTSKITSADCAKIHEQCTLKETIKSLRDFLRSWTPLSPEEIADIHYMIAKGFVLLNRHDLAKKEAVCSLKLVQQTDHVKLLLFLAAECIRNSQFDEAQIYLSHRIFQSFSDGFASAATVSPATASTATQIVLADEKKDTIPISVATALPTPIEYLQFLTMKMACTSNLSIDYKDLHNLLLDIKKLLSKASHTIIAKHIKKGLLPYEKFEHLLINDERERIIKNTKNLLVKQVELENLAHHYPQIHREKFIQKISWQLLAAPNDSLGKTVAIVSALLYENITSKIALNPDTVRKLLGRINGNNDDVFSLPEIIIPAAIDSNGQSASLNEVLTQAEQIETIIFEDMMADIAAQILWLVDELTLGSEPITLLAERTNKERSNHPGTGGVDYQYDSFSLLKVIVDETISYCQSQFVRLKINATKSKDLEAKILEKLTGGIANLYNIDHGKRRCAFVVLGSEEQWLEKLLNDATKQEERCLYE